MRTNRHLKPRKSPSHCAALSPSLPACRPSLFPGIHDPQQGRRIGGPRHADGTRAFGRQRQQVGRKNRWRSRPCAARCRWVGKPAVFVDDHEAPIATTSPSASTSADVTAQARSDFTGWMNRPVKVHDSQYTHRRPARSGCFPPVRDEEELAVRGRGKTFGKLTVDPVANAEAIADELVNGENGAASVRTLNPDRLHAAMASPRRRACANFRGLRAGRRSARGSCRLPGRVRFFRHQRRHFFAGRVPAGQWPSGPRVRRDRNGPPVARQFFRPISRGAMPIGSGSNSSFMPLAPEFRQFARPRQRRAAV